MRTPKEAFSFIRTVLRNPHIQVSPDQHHDDYSRWYFKIEIFDVKDGNVVWVLEAGKSYHINVYTSRNLNNNSQQVEEQNSIFIETPISISLKSSPPLISIEPTEYQVEPHIHRDKTYEFNVQVEKRSPKGNYQLVLYYQEAKSKNPQIITVLNLQVEGDEIGSDFVQGLCKEAHVNLEKGIPEDTAIIYIVSPRAGILEIKGWGHNAELPRTTFPQFPNLSLAKFMDSKVGPEKIWLKNHIYSMSGPIPLIKWFKKISNQCEKSFSLIIADYTLSEFPWEILQIQTGIYLGTLARIVRWIEIQVSDTYETLLPDYEKYSGTVVAYIDSEIPKNNRERDSLELCHTTYFESADSLRKRLLEPLINVSLIYLACHGEFSYDDGTTIINSPSNLTDDLRPLSLELIKEHLDKRTIIFVNACHSARLIKYGYTYYGLPTIFLRLLVKGYIGTMGAVGSDTAAHVAKWILDTARNNVDGVNIAEVLRQIRINAVNQLQDTPKNEDWFHFLYTFMYVYYGNPFTQLKIYSRPQGDTCD